MGANVSMDTSEEVRNIAMPGEKQKCERGHRENVDSRKGHMKRIMTSSPDERMPNGQEPRGGDGIEPERKW